MERLGDEYGAREGFVKQGRRRSVHPMSRGQRGGILLALAAALCCGAAGQSERAPHRRGSARSLPPPRLIPQSPFGAGAKWLAFTSAGRRLIGAAERRAVWWDLRTGKELDVFLPSREPQETVLAVSVDGTTVACRANLPGDNNV